MDPDYRFTLWLALVVFLIVFAIRYFQERPVLDWIEDVLVVAFGVACLPLLCYVRYIENQLRARYAFESVPIHLELREGAPKR